MQITKWMGLKLSTVTVTMAPNRYLADRLQDDTG